MNERGQSKSTELKYYGGASEVHLTLHYDDAYSAAVDAEVILDCMNRKGVFSIKFGEQVSKADLVNPYA